MLQGALGSAVECDIREHLGELASPEESLLWAEMCAHSIPAQRWRDLNSMPWLRTSADTLDTHIGFAYGGKGTTF